MRGEQEVDRLPNWDALHHWYRLYAKCQNASAAEGYSEAVARVLVDHWETLPRLLRIIRTDPTFPDADRAETGSMILEDLLHMVLAGGRG